MSKISLMYEFDELQNSLVPNWLVVQIPNTENLWSTLLFINIDGHADYCDYDESDAEMSLLVPYLCYVYHPDKPRNIGIHMPLLFNYIQEINKKDNAFIDHLDIQRLHLRISDIEEIMQTKIRYYEKNW